MNTVHACLIPTGVHRGEVLVWDGNLTNLGTRAFQPWSVVNPYWPAANPNPWPGRPGPNTPTYRFHNSLLQIPVVQGVFQGELFCAGQCWMADGRLLVAGGTKRYPIQTGTPQNPLGFEGSKSVWQWDHAPQTGSPFGKWWPMADLEVDRWYPTVANDGTAQQRGIVIGGTNWEAAAPTGTYEVNSYEVVRVLIDANTPQLAAPPFDRKNAPSASTTYNPVPNMMSDRQYWGPVLPNGHPAFGDYPRIHALGIFDQISPQGGVTAPRLVVSGFNAWGIRWPHDQTLDPTPVFGLPGFGTSFQFGRGYEIGQVPANPNNPGFVQYATSLLLPAAMGGISTQIRRIGGGRGLTMNVAAPSPEVETTNAGGLPSASPWQQSAPMTYPRSRGNVVMLPTGDLFAIGGDPQFPHFNLIPELLVGGTTWMPMAPHPEPRDYHSTAILLPDARVLVCGGELRHAVPNGKDYAIWEPPYYHIPHGSVPAQGITLFDETNGATLAQTGTGPQGMQPGRNYRAAWTNTLEAGIEITSVVLMRPEALTHHDDGGQRMVRLVAADDGEVPQGFAGSIVFTSPATYRHAPPGWWMLFLVNSAGRPSQAYWVHL